MDDKQLKTYKYVLIAMLCIGILLVIAEIFGFRFRIIGSIYTGVTFGLVMFGNVKRKKSD